ncbi:MAG: hypothetical protein F6K21_04540 [Symploca sp. SIO2D2]|nr:hypothetical protein [Symploca sp. SIO2D2]
MKKVICGHWNFIVKDAWILCQDCHMGININSPQGQRLLKTKESKSPLDFQQQQAYNSLVESYKELVKNAGTDDPEVLASFANNSIE